MGDRSPVSKKGSQPSSPKAGSAPASSSERGSPAPAVAAGILPAQHWVQVAEDEGGIDEGDAASIAEGVATSTASLTSSILKYRKIQGRTYHSDVGNADYWGANDERQNESMDINHHVLTLMLGGRLYLAPIDTGKVQRVLDVGTGTGTWAIDFADDYPNIQVTGTDISPIQPSWIPPNLKFEIEDCTRDWTFEPESLDYIHMRWLKGSVTDWDDLYAQAYRALKPGGWLESYEGAANTESDDGSVVDTSAISQWGRIFINFGESIGRSFTIVADNVQPKAMEGAGFVDIKEVDFNTPIGRWPKDPRLKEIGECAQLVLETDMEGYILYPATALGWSPAEISVFTAHVRRNIRSPDFHGYYRQKVVWGRKPGKPEEA